MQTFYSTFFLVLALHLHVAAQDDSWSSKKSISEEKRTTIRLNLDAQIVELADRQDELSADIQELIEEQTDEKVIQTLENVELLMTEALDKLDEKHTGGQTIAIETEIIEQIFNSAEKKQQQQQKESQDKKPSGMMQMMRQMLGKDSSPSQPGGNKPSPGATGDPSKGTAPQSAGSAAGQFQPSNKTQRRVPYQSGSNTGDIPQEFRSALEAYNSKTQQRLQR